MLLQKKFVPLGGFFIMTICVLVLAVLSVSAVFAYNASLKFAMPMSFQIQNCTIESGSNLIFSSNPTETRTTSASFVVNPISKDTLQVSCQYSALSATAGVFGLSVTNGHSLELIKLVAYGKVAYDQSTPSLNNNDFVESTFAAQTLTITLKSGLTMESTDNVTFDIQVSATTP